MGWKTTVMFHMWWGDKNTMGAGRRGVGRRGHSGLETQSRSIAEISWRVLKISVCVLFSYYFVL